MNGDAAPFPGYFEVSNLSTSFEGRAVLRGVTLSVPKREATVIVGGSGAGKSVLLKHLIGLLRPDSGTVFVDGRDLGPLRERELVPIRRRIGYVFQNGALFDSLTVGENVAFPLQEQGEKDPVRIRSLVEEALQRVELEKDIDKMPAALSGGMKKRASLARAIVTEPECILYDEPTSGLDPILARNIVQLIKQLQRDLELTTVVVTHNLGAMKEIAGRVVFVEAGTVKFSGTVSELEAAGDPDLREFLAAGLGYSE